MTVYVYHKKEGNKKRGACEKIIRNVSEIVQYEDAYCVYSSGKYERVNREKFTVTVYGY